MSPSLREQIIQRVIDRLLPVITAAGGILRRQPGTPTERLQMPAFLLFPESESVRRINDRTERELVLCLIALAAGSATEIPERITDGLIVAAHARLFADVTLGGLALGLEEIDTDWRDDDADLEMAALPVRYRITYRTFAHDLTLKG